MRSFLRKYSLVAIKILITVGLLVYLSRKVNLSLILHELSKINLPLYFASVATFGISMLLASYRWKLILRAQSLNLSLSLAVCFQMIGLFFSVFLPGATGGDAIRAYYAILHFKREKTRIIVSILFDRALGLFALLVFGVLALKSQASALAHLAFVGPIADVVPALVAFGAFVLILIFFLPSSRLPNRLHKLAVSWTQRGIFGKALVFLQRQRHNPRLLIESLVISVVAYAITFLSAQLAAQSMGIDAEYSQIMVILAVLYTVLSIPISIGGHGVREVLLIALFSALHIGTAEAAVLFSLLLFSLQLVMGILGSAVFLIVRRVNVVAAT
jgi:uncharacterized protein (TIRG00374 family)